MDAGVVGVPVLQAFLKKRNDRSRWRVKVHTYGTRYFVLYPGYLVWSLKKGGDIVGMIPLETLHYVAHLEHHNHGKRFDILVHRTPLQRHTFCLLANSREDALTWVKHLKITMKHFGKGHQASFDTTVKFWKMVDLMLTDAIAVQPGWTNSLKTHLQTYRDTSTLDTPASPVQKMTSRHSAMTAKSKKNNASAGFDITTDEIGAPAPPQVQEEDDSVQAILQAEAETAAAAETKQASESLSMFQRVLRMRSAETSYAADDTLHSAPQVQHWREPISLEDIVNHYVYVGYFYSYLTEVSLSETLEFVLAIKLAKQVR